MRQRPTGKVDIRKAEMQQVQPYRTERGLLKALDNGGRFYNVFTKAGDNQVTRAELAAAAGGGSAAKAALFFDMAQVGLGDAARARANRALGPKASKDYKKHRPITVRPSEVDAGGKNEQGVIVQGVPRFLRDKSQFTGMMMLPISTGTVTTFMMIPLYDQFDVYEVFDDRRMRRPCCVVATTRGIEFAANQPVRFAGILKKMEAEKDTERRHRFYLEAHYYTRA
ncbi:MAG: hypothetical protein CL477_08720 [Acidobacteria bacterium]|nr:hypothetical protein [Acidobacteriota bacterium]HJN45699.1 hypothetical protein [Vicinamibacterales bacterium]